MFKKSTILVTGGSGSWGNEVTRQLLEMEPKKIIIFSRGEIAQVTMQRKFNDIRIEYVIGDVRDCGALDGLFQKGIDYVFHLAALKHVPICEYQPQEAIKTNIGGTTNLINVSIKYKVKKFLFVSTDKAVDPINTYGMTKGISERLIIEANCNTTDTEFIIIRGGNVLGTNGSLVPFIIEQIKTKNEVLLTDKTMTRFFLTIEKAVQLLFFAMEEGIGGETYVMIMPGFFIKDLFDILVKHYGDENTKIKIIGKREGEKIDETLISILEATRTRYINSNYYVIYPQLETGRTYFHIWDEQEYTQLKEAMTSQTNIEVRGYLKELLDEGGFLV